MPRLARTVFSGVAHRITQRGNRREDVFYSDEDRRAYLAWMREYCAKRWKGRLWQGRFFASAIDDTYLWAALRYVDAIRCQHAW